jgi:glycosyltransferase involved in cell wall biosynthesis
VLDALLVRALRAKAWRIVYAVHDPLPEPLRRTAFRHHRALLLDVDAAVVHTEQQQRELVRRIPEMAGRVSVIVHGAAPRPLPDADERLRSRTALALDHTRPLLLFFGQIKPYKGLEYLLDAMPDVVARFPNVQLLVVGEPLMSLRRFQRQIATLGVHEHVSLRPGFVPAHQVPHYFRAADLFVAPYVRAGASGTLVMAQEYALPTVVTNVGGLPDFAVPGECGFVVPPRSPAALAAAICQALGDNEARVQMGLRALNRLARDNDWSLVAEQTVQLYRTLDPGVDASARRLSVATPTSL